MCAVDPDRRPHGISRCAIEPDRRPHRPSRRHPAPVPRPINPDAALPPRPSAAVDPRRACRLRHRPQTGSVGYAIDPIRGCRWRSRQHRHPVAGVGRHTPYTPPPRARQRLDNSKKRPQGAKHRDSYARGRGVASRWLACVHRSSSSAAAPESTAAAARASPSPSALASESESEHAPRTRRKPCPRRPQPGGGHRGGRVGQHHVADRPTCPAKHLPHHRRVHPRVAAAQVRDRTLAAAPARPGRTRSPSPPHRRRPAKMVDGPAGAELVDTAVAVEHQGRLPALGKHPRQHTGPIAGSAMPTASDVGRAGLVSGPR